MKTILKTILLFIFINSINSFLFGGLGGGGGSSCCGGSSSCCGSSGGGGCSFGGYSSSYGGYSSSCGGGCSSGCGGYSSGGGCSSGCGSYSSGGCSSGCGGYSNGGGCSSGCGSYSSGGCSSGTAVSSNCGSSCNSGYSSQQYGGGSYNSQSSGCAPTTYSNPAPQSYQQQVVASPQMAIPEPYHQPAPQIPVQNMQQYQAPPQVPPVQSQQPSGGGYGGEPQPQSSVPASSNSYNDVPHHAAADINVEVKSSEDEQINSEKKPTSSTNDVLETEIPPVPLDQIPLINDEDCNVAELREIMKKSIVSDINISKRKIQIEAEKKYGGRFDVICATHDFSYLSNTELYCQVSSKINNMIYSCYSYRQL
uniref:Ground-like domain-containing protein n=1 Tax=Strongyloides papillosus TaxID=174720 RepID=A0A0N5B6C2_STREA